MLLVVFKLSLWPAFPVYWLFDATWCPGQSDVLVGAEGEVVKTEGLEMTFNDDGGVPLKWGLQTEDDQRIGEEGGGAG